MAQNNLAENLMNSDPQRKPIVPNVVPVHRTSTETVTAPEKLKMSTFEKLLISACSLVLAALMITVVSSKITLSTAQRDLQSVTTSVNTLQTKNGATQQQINELKSKTRLDKIAKSQGMSLSNAKIRNVNR